MHPPLQRYVGSAEYCYANSASMLLASVGEKIDPALVECATAVGLGARYWLRDRSLYFSNLPPDIGLSNAFSLVGFDVQEGWSEDLAAPALESLRAFVSEGPVLIGPLDMQHLTYLPGHRGLAGADHYVLVAGTAADGAFRLHDPKGYPNVLLGGEDLERAWRADSVSYARGPFRWWRLPVRREEVDERELARRCLDAFRRAYGWSDKTHRSEIVAGDAAFETAAQDLESGENEALCALLLSFGLPLGARRSHDLAVFLHGRAPALSATKEQQAIAFIDTYRFLMQKDGAAAARVLRRIGELDARFHLCLHGES